MEPLLDQRIEIDLAAISGATVVTLAFTFHNLLLTSSSVMRRHKSEVSSVKSLVVFFQFRLERNSREILDFLKPTKLKRP